MVMALGLLLADFGSVQGQTAARVEYRDGRLGVAVAVGDLPTRVRAAPVYGRGGWVETAWRPERVHVRSGRTAWRQDTLRKQELRHLLGKETVKTLERHARTLRLHGPLAGSWYRSDRRTVVLEVTVRGAPVAEVVDYGGDGIMDRFYLAPVPGYYHDR